MKKVVLLLLAALTLCACQPRSVTEGKRAWTKYLKKVLKDPESLKIYSEEYEELNDHTVRWTIDYGAKNSYGGMDRKTIVVETTYATLKINGNLIDTDDL